MDCQKCQDNLNAYLDGELEGRLFGEIEHHVSRCAGCTDELDRLVKMRSLLHELREVEVPEGERELFVEALRNRIESEEGKRYASKRINWVPAYVVAAVLVVILIVIVLVPRKPPIPMIKPAPGLRPIQNMAIDRVIGTSLEAHMLGATGDFLADPALTKVQIRNVMNVLKETHSELLEPAE